MKCMLTYGSLERSQYKWMSALFAVCTDVSLADDGENGQIQLAVHVGNKIDLEIFTTIVRGNEACGKKEPWHWLMVSGEGAL